MKVQLKRMVTIRTAAIVIATASGTFIGNSYASEVLPPPKLPRCDAGPFAGLKINCGAAGTNAVVVVFTKGTQKPCSCNFDLFRCDPNKTSGGGGFLEDGDSDDGFPTCLSDEPLTRIPIQTEVIHSSCTVCTTQGGKKKCSTNNAINC